MTARTPDELAAIEARLAADEAEYGTGYEYEQSFLDRRALLTLIREQAAKLEAVSKIAARLEDRATLNARVSATGIYDEQMQLAADAASSIAIVTAGDLRAAITATEAGK